MIKDQLLDATLLQTGAPMWSVAHPSKLEEGNTGIKRESESKKGDPVTVNPEPV